MKNLHLENYGSETMPPQSLSSLVLAALNSFSQLMTLCELLEVILEEFDYPTEKTQLRVQLLLDLYRARVENQLDELRVALDRIRQRVDSSLIAGDPPDTS